ncbi:MAG: cytochrome c oxidase subunit II [Chitinophagaceae bacterium]|nr:cytochrome c oxidase subunit II [Chitinophagaceae bacterium]
MLTTIFILGILFTILIIFILAKISKVTDILKGTQNKDEKDTKSNKVNAFLMMLFLFLGIAFFAWYSFTHFKSYDLPLASAHGKETDFLFWSTIAIISVAFIITHIILFGFSWKYQYKKLYRAKYYPENHTLEFIWTIIPAIVLTFLIISGLDTWQKITGKAPEDAVEIEVMAYQFAWVSRYPGKDNQLGKYHFRLTDSENRMGIDFSDKASYDDFIPREIHIPKGKNVKFNVRSRDVIHSFYLPHFRAQINAVPGLPTTFWLLPTKSTEDMRKETGNPEFNYELVCNKICGKGHFSMKYIVIVDEPKEYEKWLLEQTPWIEKNPSYVSQRITK